MTDPHEQRKKNLKNWDQVPVRVRPATKETLAMIADQENTTKSALVRKWIQQHTAQWLNREKS